MKLKRCGAIICSVVIAAVMSGCGKEVPPDPDVANDTTVSETTSATSSEASKEAADSENQEDELQPEEGAKLVFWIGDQNYGEAVGKAFEEKYEVPVSVEKLGMGQIDKLSLTGPSGKAADVVSCSSDLFISGMESGVFLPIDDEVAQRVKARVSEVGIDTVKQDNKLYGVPYAIETSCLFYNKDLVDKPAKTLEEIINTSKTYNDTANNKFYFLCAMTDTYKAFPFLSAFGYRPFGVDGTDNDHPGFDTDEYKMGLQLINSFHDLVPVASTDLRNAEFVRSLFTEGKVAYHITGPWDVDSFKEAGVNFGVTTLPTYNGKSLTPFAGVKNVHISSWTKYPQAAQLFAEFLVSDEGAKLLYDSKQITTLKDVSSVEGLSDDEYLKPFAEQFNNSVPMPGVSNVGAFWSATETAIIAMYDGQLTPEEAQKNTIDTFNTTLATQGE